jgi:hypothetical protein
MRSFCLMLSRFSLSAWIGAAALFVVTSIGEQTSTQFDSAVKNTLAAIRFPWYYLFGFVLVSLGLLGAMAGLDRAAHWRRWCLVAATLSVSLVLMLIDYFAIYTPLRDIVTNLSGVRDARFLELHRWSEQINSLDVVLCFIAAVAVCWPETGSSPLRQASPASQSCS